MLQAHKRLSGEMKRVHFEFNVPEAVQEKMSKPMSVVKFSFFDPTDQLVRLLALSPLGVRGDNMALFPEAGHLLHDFCHGARLRRIYETIPDGAAVLSAAIFFDEINRDAKGFSSGDGAIVVGGFYRQRVRESTYAKASIGTFPQIEFPKVRVSFEMNCLYATVLWWTAILDERYNVRHLWTFLTFVANEHF
jgi:hypothetical protein